MAVGAPSGIPTPVAMGRALRVKRLVRATAIVLLVATASLVAVVVCFVALDVGLAVVRHASAPGIHEVTTPLSPLVIQDVCQRLALPDGHHLCGAGAIVYAPDFFATIKAAFVPGVTSYDEIEARLGPYRYHCEAPVEVRSLGLTVFTCHYDFNGDRAFPFAFCFTDDGVLYATYADPYGGD